MSIAIPAGLPWDDGCWAAAILRAAGFQAWFVGGCVRDLLLNRVVHDVDVTTDAHPDQVAVLFPRVLEVGKVFGVMIAITAAGRHVEIATFRSDAAYVDGRRPSGVVFTTAEDDVNRRDFTINALLLDPLSGELRDHVGGLDDLRARRLRLVGVARDRLWEDRLRVLRGLRFAAHLGFTCTGDTWSALCSTSLEGLSRERIWQEWDKALSAAGRSRWLGLVQETGHLHEVCPLLGPVTAAIAQLEQITPDDDALLPGALVLAAAPAAALWPWLLANPLPRERIQRLRWLREGADALVAGAAVPARRRLFQHADAALLVRYLAIRGEVPQAAAWLATERQAGPFTPLLRAGDLLAAGIRPGPEVGRLLRLVEDAQLSGEVADRSAALSLALTAQAR